MARQPSGTGGNASESDDSYDSEEERLQARRAAVGRCAALRMEQAAQAELLRAYQARRQLKQELEEQALHAKLRQQRSSVGSGEWWPRGSDSGGGPGGGQHAVRAWLHALQQHESRWARLEAGAGGASAPPGCSAGAGGGEAAEADTQPGSGGPADGGSIAYTDVPWPPLDCGEYLLGLAAWEEHRQQEGRPSIHHQQQEQQRARRRAYARACLRWHPDKFEGRWGRRLVPADRPRILQRVQQVSQGLNQAWEGLQLQQERQPAG